MTCECEKRDFHSNLTLAERVARLEAAVFDRGKATVEDCETDHPIERLRGQVFADAARDIYDHAVECRKVPTPEEVQEYRNRIRSAQIEAGVDKAATPIDLLRQFRRVFEHDAKVCRDKEKLALSELEKRAIGARAYANETAVSKIDLTLRDWA